VGTERRAIKVLLIENDTAAVDRIRETLAGESGVACRLDHVSHLVDALGRLQYHRADVVLVGLGAANLTGTSGVKLLADTFDGLPIVAVTAGRDPVLIAEARAAGAIDSVPQDCRDGELWARTLRWASENGRLRKRLAAAEGELERRSCVDPLTGLLNRRGIEQSLLRELHHCRRQGTDLMVALVDLDDFRRVNSTLEHGIGDTVLQNAADRIRSVVESKENVGRAGADQFLVLLPGIDEAEGMILAERIRLAICRDRIVVAGQPLMMTASVGLTTVPADAVAITEVLARAHVALHCSKTQGKNKVSCALESQGEPNGTRPVLLSGEMVKSLLCEDVLQVATQPIVRLADNRICSREMLIRGPEGPLQAPDDLFRFCLEKDILTPVDLHCLRKCVAAASRLDEDSSFHVNIMPSTLLETPTGELIRLLSSGVDPRRCCLEISEQQLLNDPSPLVGSVEELRRAQVQVAIDDVSFGNSCLEGLILLQPGVIKIDKRLVIGLGTDRRRRESLERVLKVAEVLEAEVVAEGVESAEDLSVLQDFEVPYAQGNFFAAPQICEVSVAGEEELFHPIGSAPPS